MQARKGRGKNNALKNGEKGGSLAARQRASI